MCQAEGDPVGKMVGSWVEYATELKSGEPNNTNRLCSLNGHHDRGNDIVEDTDRGREKRKITETQKIMSARPSIFGESLAKYKAP